MQARTEAVVNAAVMTALVVADPTRMNPGQTVEVGALTELGLEQLGHNGVSRRAGRVPDRAELDGVHTYFTNEKTAIPSRSR